MLVLDEADLLLSYGYEEDVAALAPQVRFALAMTLGLRGGLGALRCVLPAEGLLLCGVGGWP